MSTLRAGEGKADYEVVTKNNRGLVCKKEAIYEIVVERAESRASRGL